ncbi:hypothetical protein ABZ553_14865 [Streptomyces sparsogenes]|uniref:hypothetical protein n=1 Tax=Streptomyces sparsogenes TaxID=67365 RepID=UPI0033FF051F
MAGQISLETALGAFRKKCADLLDANVLLEARVTELEAEVEQLRPQASAGAETIPAPSGPAGDAKLGAAE